MKRNSHNNNVISYVTIASTIVVVLSLTIFGWFQWAEYENLKSQEPLTTESFVTDKLGDWHFAIPTEFSVHGSGYHQDGSSYFSLTRKLQGVADYEPLLIVVVTELESQETVEQYIANRGRPSAVSMYPIERMTIDDLPVLSVYSQGGIAPLRYFFVEMDNHVIEFWQETATELNNDLEAVIVLVSSTFSETP